GALGPQSRATTYPLLLAALRDEDATVSEAAHQALKKLGPPPAADVQLLGSLLSDESLPVRRHAIESLAQLKDKAAPAAAAILLAVQHDSSAEIRRLAIQALMQVRPREKDSIEAFTQALRDRDPLVARQAVQALVATGVEEAVPGLLRALEHSDAEV